jgi:hypothetical protein
VNADAVLWGWLILVTVVTVIRMVFWIRQGGVTIMGQDVAPATLVQGLIFVALVWGLMAATKLNIIADHAP